MTILKIFLPFLLIVVLYTIVCLKLWSRQVPGEGANQDERQAEDIKTAKKVTWMMIAVVVFFCPVLVSILYYTYLADITYRFCAHKFTFIVIRRVVNDFV